MKLKNQNLVSINIPRFVIPEEFAEKYIMSVNKFCCDLRNNLIEDHIENNMDIGEFDNVYTGGDFYPVFYKKTTLEGTGNLCVPEIENIPKYVEAPNKYILDRDAMLKLFKDSEVQE